MRRSGIPGVVVWEGVWRWICCQSSTTSVVTYWGYRPMPGDARISEEGLAPRSGRACFRQIEPHGHRHLSRSEDRDMVVQAWEEETARLLHSRAA